MSAPDQAQPLIIVGTARDADRVAAVLDSEGVAYVEELEGHLESETSNVCYLGTRFLVAAEDLQRSKQILAAHGIAIG